MFSNKYYLFNLLKNTPSFSKIEKQKIFNFLEKKQEKILEFIKILEEDKKWWEYIKNSYKKNINKIGENFKKDLLKWIEEKKILRIKKIKNKISDLQKEEKLEKKEENLDLLFNQI